MMGAPQFQQWAWTHDPRYERVHWMLEEWARANRGYGINLACERPTWTAPPDMEAVDRVEPLALELKTDKRYRSEWRVLKVRYLEDWDSDMVAADLCYMTVDRYLDVLAGTQRWIAGRLGL